MKLQILQSPLAKLVVWTATLLVMSIIGVYIVRRYRDGAEDNETSSDMLTKFQDSRVRGELNDAEFRTIKTILAERMQAELKHEDDSS